MKHVDLDDTGIEPKFVREAYEFAKKAHEGQVRKFTGQAYIQHPLRVFRNVEDWGIVDPEVLAAACLHDVVEDCGVDMRVIDDTFSVRVGNIVETLTKPDGVDKKTQRTVAMQQLRKGSPEAAVIKMADRIDNILDYPIEKLGWDYLAEAGEIRNVAASFLAPMNAGNWMPQSADEVRLRNALQRGYDALGSLIIYKLRQKGGWVETV